MNVYRRIEAFFVPSDAVWERHSKPWSEWTRVPILPLLALAIYARVWIGPWCLIPITALLVWAWYNPRAFPPPKSRAAWMTRAAHGERIWLHQTIPAHHRGPLRLLAPLPLPGLIGTIWGLYTLNAPVTFVCVAFTVMTKMWFLDRMVWLYEDTPQDQRP